MFEIADVSLWLCLSIVTMVLCLYDCVYQLSRWFCVFMTVFINCHVWFCVFMTVFIDCHVWFCVFMTVYQLSRLVLCLYDCVYQLSRLVFQTLFYKISKSFLVHGYSFPDITKTIDAQEIFNVFNPLAVFRTSVQIRSLYYLDLRIPPPHPPTPERFGVFIFNF